MARHDLLAIASGERPGIRFLVERRAGDADPEARRRGQSVPVGAVLGIGRSPEPGAKDRDQSVRFSNENW